MLPKVQKKNVNKKHYIKKKNEIQIEDNQLDNPSINIDTNKKSISNINIESQLEDSSDINIKTEVKKNCIKNLFLDLDEDFNTTNNVNNLQEANTKIVKCTPVLSGSSIFRFRPINLKWQKEQSKKLGLVYIHNDYFKASKNSILHPPVECYDIVGDGNCFFRCIALCVTGSQVNHQYMRQLIVDFMQINSDKVDRFSGIKNYMQNSGMIKLATWATDIEICFTAAFIEADIYTFTSNSKGIFNWVRYPSSLTQKEEPNYNKMALYLYHKNSKHFEVVIKVKKQGH